MKNCTYKLNINGKEMVFNSDQELDAFLGTNVDSFDITKLDKTFAIDPVQATVSKLDKIKISPSNVSKSEIRPEDDPEEAEQNYSIPNYIGVLSFLSKWGNAKDVSKPILPPFNQEDWKNNKIKTLKDQFISENNESEESALSKAIKITEDTVKSWSILTETGEEIHAIIQSQIDGSTPKIKHLSKEIADQVKSYATAMLDSLKAKYGENAKFYSEFAIKSQNISPEIRTILRASGYDGLSGRIDMLIVDEVGQAHIFDFKVSRKNWGGKDMWDVTSNEALKETWHSVKKLAVANQLSFYNAMLKQYDIPVRDCSIIPIDLKLKYDDENTKANITEITGVKINSPFEVPRTKSGNIYNNVLSIVPSSINMTDEDALGIIKKTKELFPEADISMQVQQRSRDVDWFKDERHKSQISLVKLKNKDLGDWRFVEKGIYPEKVVYCTDNNLDQKLADYISRLNTVRTNELRTFADTVQDVVEGDKEIDQLGENFNKFNSYQSFVINEFKKYKTQHWRFEKNTLLNSAGIFIFKKNGKSEIVCISNKPLMQRVKMAFGTSIQGMCVSDTHIDKTKTLDGTYANIEAMKALVYLSDHQDQFINDRISEIRVINPWTSENKEVTNVNSMWLNNFNDLILKNPKIGIKTLNPNMFWDDVTGLLATAYSNIEETDMGWIDFQLVPEAKDMVYTSNNIQDRINKLKATQRERGLYDWKKYNPSDPYWQCLVYLTKAYNATQGIFSEDEVDPGHIFTGGLNPNGLLLASGQFSQSVNIRTFAKVHDQYISEVRQKSIELGWAVQKAFMDFYEESKTIKLIGGESSLFKSWFRTDENGKISEEFILKDPDDPDFVGGPKAKKALRLFLDTMFKLRYPDATDEDLENAKVEGIYYEVPLLEAKFSRQAKSNGIISAISEKFKQYRTLSKDVFAEDEKLGIKQKYQLTHHTIYNKFDLEGEARREKIKQHGVGFFETHLELVFNEALVAYVKQEASKKYVPIFQGMQLALQYAKQHGEEQVNDVSEALEKMIDSKFYGESIVKKDLQMPQRFFNVIKKFFSTTMLGFNFSSMFRELLQGTFMGFSRSAVKTIDGMDAKTYLKGAKYTITECYKNVTGVSMMNQLNMQYGMANMSLSQLAGQRRTNWLGIKNWGTDTMFLTASCPDFQHRMSLLVAKMMHDGSWEAHSLDADGKLLYNWKKDKRFIQYANGNTSNIDYIAQKTLYLKYIEEYNRIGYKNKYGENYKEGDDLPMAYAPKEQQTLKNYADLFYGHYDDESKSLVNDTFLGSYFMQYKTYITSRLEQWMMTPQIYNTESLKQQYDPVTHERLYMKTTYENPDNTGMFHRDIIRESELTEADKKSGLVEAYVKWEGDPMEGMLWPTLEFMKSLFKMDQKKLNELWQDPLKRSKLILSINDMFVMWIMGILISALFGKSEDIEHPWDQNKVRIGMRSKGWGEQFAYKIAIGSVNDFSLPGILINMTMDWNPPMITSLTRFAKSTWGVFTGNNSALDVITQNFGALREFQGVVRNMEAK